MARYEIVPEQSMLRMDVTSNVHPIRLETSEVSGWIDAAVDEMGRLDETVVPTGEVAFDAASLASGNALEDFELRRRIEAKRHPTITAKLLGMDKNEPDGVYRVRGMITFRDKEYPYEGDVTLTPEGDDAIRFEAVSTFDMRYFDVDPPNLLMFKVAPEVRSQVDVVARRST